MERKRWICALLMLALCIGVLPAAAEQSLSTMLSAMLNRMTETEAPAEPVETAAPIVIAVPATEPPTQTASPIVIIVPETQAPAETASPIVFIAPVTQAPAETASPIVFIAPVTQATAATTAPTAEPTAEPTAVPTEAPTTEPTAEPTMAPTTVPAAEPTAVPAQAQAAGAAHKLNEVSLSAEVDLSQAKVMGVSPDGATVIVSDGTVLYMLTGGEAKALTSLSAKSVEDQYGNLSKSLKLYATRFPGAEGVIWSPDGRYAVMPNYEYAMVNATFVFDPLVLDTKTGEGILLDTYPSKITEGAVMSHACFSSDSRYLYAFLYGTGFEGRVTLMRYDLESGEKQVLHSSDAYVGRPGVFQTKDGSIIGLTDSMDRSDAFGLRVYEPGLAGYALREVTTGYSMQQLTGTQLEYAAASGTALIRGSLFAQYQVALMIGSEEAGFEDIKTVYVVESLESTQLTALDASGIKALDQTTAEQSLGRYASITCARLSPDGRSALLNCVVNGEGALMLLDIESKTLSCVEMPEAYSAKYIGTAPIGMTLGRAFAPGFVWNKDGTILMLTDSVRAYRLE